MNKNWTRDELLIALGLYCKIPFGQFHQRQPLVVQVAEHLDRSPSSIAMKLSNLASLDPVIIGSGRKGLASASSLDREVWQAFSENTAEMMPAAEAALEAVLNGTIINPDAQTPAFDEDDHFANAKVRRGQKLFRDAVLSAYEYRCCVTGVDDPRFLVASHIRPWREDKENRLNPSNGLCLSLMVDKAFDLGLITFSEDYRLMLSTDLTVHKSNPHMSEAFFSNQGKSIHQPSKFAPNDKLLAWHRETFFVDAIK